MSAGPTWRVDCHVHTAFSGDARVTLDEIGSALENDVVDVVCVTDHNSVRGGLAAAQRWPDRVIAGAEVRTWAGEIIGLFLTEHVPRKSDPAEVCKAIRAQGGIVYVPHPFCPFHAGIKGDALDRLVGEGLVDAIEVFNAKVGLDSANRAAEEYAIAHGIAGGAGSDAHYPEFLGYAYVEMAPFSGPREFLAGLQDGRICGRRYTYADAKWQTKLVP